MKTVVELKYLGSIAYQSGLYQGGIENRICESRKAIAMLNYVLRSNNVL